MRLSPAEQFGNAAKQIVESMKRGDKPNLFDDRASALAFLKGDSAARGTVK